LADFLEREVDERTRAAVEAHALGCADCGPLLADLRKLRIDAANLPELAPSRDLWSGIAARIEAPVIELPGVGGGRWVTGEQRKTGDRRRVWMALAAAGLVAVTAGVTYVATKKVVARDSARTVATQTVPTPAPINSSASDTIAPQPDTTNPAPVAGTTGVVAASNTSIDVRPSPASRRGSPMEDEITRLKAIVTARRSQLDPTTLGIVDRNLVVIDSAIAQVKQALQKDPESRFLMESLNNALENKVEILRTAASLPSRA
jgi:hypothetical protein